MRENTSERRAAVRLVALATLGFALLLALGVWLYRSLPGWQLRHIDSSLERGDYALAGRVAERLWDEELSTEQCARVRYAEAGALEAAGELAEARTLFAALGNYSDAAVRADACGYALAGQLTGSGAYSEAEALWQALRGYADSLTRYDACRYAHADSLERSGALTEAAELFRSLGEYEDAVARLTALAVRITGIENEEEALFALAGLSAEEQEHRAALAAQRLALPRQVLAAGFTHTLGLREDGTVLVCGSNAYGQCDASGWTDITAVAAGAYHSAALKRDGTVLACGRSTEGQCDTAAWTEVVMLACGDYDTYALRADGTLLHTGYNDRAAFSGWSGLVSITAGAYGVAALRTDGSALFSTESAALPELISPVALALNTGYGAALSADGRVRCTALDTSGWQDILALAASPTGLWGLDAAGNVHAVFFRESAAPDVSSLRDVRAMAASGTHALFLLADGRVTGLGDNSSGQLEVGVWQLFSPQEETE